MTAGQAASLAHGAACAPDRAPSVRAVAPPTFAEVLLRDPVQVGDAELSAERIHTWVEGGVTRALAEGAVRLRVGRYEFDAKRAALWARTVPRDGRSVVQLGVSLDTFSQGDDLDGERLLVTGVVDGTVRFRTDVMTPPAAPPPERDPFLMAAEASLGRHLARLVGEPVERDPVRDGPPRFPAPVLPAGDAPLARRAPVIRKPIAGEGVADVRPAEPGGQLIDPRLDERAPIAPVATDETFDPPPPVRLVRPERGTLSWSLGPRGEATFEPIDAENPNSENILVLTGGVVVQYNEAQSTRAVQLSAQRAIIFMEPGAIADLARSESDSVIGMYLEGDVVATDGSYNLRGPRVYYDAVAGEALMIDAVFWTYDERRDLPLYMRAEAIRQEAPNRFSAQDARLSTSAFHDPHFSVGATSITITRPERADGMSSTVVDARNLTARVKDVPFLYWPVFMGDVENFPLRAIQVETNQGGAIKTSWDLFSLTGLPRPDELSVDILADGYFDRGAALGTDINWNTGDAFGSFFAYTLIEDNGADELTSGAEVQQDYDTRGIVIGEHRWNIDDRWTVAIEGAWVSDETFVDAFFEPFAETRREFTTGAMARRLEENTSLTLSAKTNVNDFIPNEYLLQSQGYSVQKAPEVGYARLADDLLGGAVSYSSETRLSYMALEFTERTPEQLGFNTVARAREAFGLAPGDEIGDALRASGLTEDDVLRFDTRHEVSAPINAGPFRFEPFVVGRVTAYDQDFETFNGDNDDTTRLWGSAGARASTSMVRVYDDAESRLLGIHRLRHIIEPSITGWVGGTNLSQTELPVYDDEVESLADASVLRFGLDQTLQTQRGGPGRWRSVDLLKVRTEFVFTSDDADTESPIDRYFDYRPEYSQLGDSFVLDTSWQMTDGVAISQHLTFDFDTNQIARFSAGALLEHTQSLNSFIEARTINARDVTFLDAGITYRLTDKYRTGLTMTYDTDEGDFQNLGVRVQRRFPNATFGFSLNFNNITGRTNLGLVFQPAGVESRSAARLSRLGASSR